MADPLASVAGLETRLGRTVGSLSGLDLARATSALADASDLVRAQAGVGWTGDTGSLPAPPAVVVVVLQAAMRAFVNPNSYQSESVAGGGASYSYSTAVHGIYLTDDEIQAVTRAADTMPRRWSGTGSVRVGMPYVPPATHYEPWEWCP